MPIRILAAFIIFLFLIIVSLWVSLIMALESKSYAHEAIPTAAQPFGWAYPSNCCSGQDCKDAKSFVVRETPNGYDVFIRPGEHAQVKDGPYTDLIPYGDVRIKESPDQLFHVCISSYMERKPSRTICLFVPPRSF